MKNLNFTSLILIGCIAAITTSCKKEPNASFSLDKTLVEINETVNFTNQTFEGRSYNWDFGDGTTSTEKDPSHNWSTPGDYEITLTAYSKKEKFSSERKLNIRVVGYAYKFDGIYAGINHYQSWYCGSGSESNNVLVKADLFGNNFTISNLDNRFPSISGTITEPGYAAIILPQTGVVANGGIQWNLDTIKIFLNYSYNTNSFSNLWVTHTKSDSSYSNICGWSSSFINAEK